MSQQLIQKLIKEKENLYIEFKCQWYWDNGVRPTEPEWGEFLKDFVALINCNEQYVEENKYLIIGIDENELELKNRILDVNLTDNNFPTLAILKEEIIKKINTYFRIEVDEINVFDDFTLEYYQVENKKILVFEIRPTKNILVLNKDLTDKKRTEKKNNVFIRGIKETNDPEVLNASPEVLEILSQKIREYRGKVTQEDRKTKSIEKTINLFVQNNHSYRLENPHKLKDWKNLVLYEIFPIKSEFVNIDFIYIFDKTSQQKTYEYIKKEKLFTDKAKRYVLIDNNLKKDTKGIKEKFEAEKVFSLDEFALEYLYKDYLNQDIYHDGNFKKQRQIQNFIEPYTTESDEKNALIILLEWYKKISKPLMVIKGYGGVGKTTLIRYFLDDLYVQNKQESTDAKILFIDSKEIINEISRQGQVDNIYDFYDAFAKKNSLEKKLNKELLELSIDNGNLLIVLDGIDEVIAKLGNKFNVENFITTIYSNYSIGNERTKIIITCRDYFWDNSFALNNGISTLELKAFNQEMTEKLFSKQFRKDSKEFAKCIALSKELAISDKMKGKEENVYVPYILDVIMDMVKQNQEFGAINKSDVESELLNTELTNDYFIGRICNREIEKLKNLQIDSQLTFFINMAVKFNGNAHISSAVKLFRGLAIQPSYDLIEKFKGHPLISYKNDTFNFRYDFFKEYFMNLYISEFFVKKSSAEMDEDLRDMVNEYIRYDNSFTEFICRRIKFDDDFKLFIIEIIGNLIAKLKLKDTINHRKSISSILILLLVGFRLQNGKNDINTRTELLIDIFGANFGYLSLINLFGQNQASIYPIFDFKDKNIQNAWFENYEYFWECKINESTSFHKSTFTHLKPRQGVTLPNIHENLFINCNTLGIEDLLLNKEATESSRTKKIKSEVLRIFKHFEQNGTFKEKKIDDTRKKMDTNILDELIKYKIITPYKNPSKPTMKQYKVSDEYFDLIKILDQSGTSVELERVLSIFKN